MYFRLNPGVETPLLSLTSSVVVLLSPPPISRIVPSSLLQLLCCTLFSLRLCVLVHWPVVVSRVWQDLPESGNPPHCTRPSWLWKRVPTGSEGRVQEVLVPGW